MHIAIRSWAATALGTGCAALTGRVILDDVIAGGQPLGIGHMMSIAALVITIAAGHYLVPQLKAGRVLIALGLAALFAAGTLYLVTVATMRNADSAAAKAATIKATNEIRTGLRGQLETAEADLAEAKKALTDAEQAAAAECGSGKGRKCEGRETTRANAERARDRAESHVRMLAARIELLGPEREENGSYARVAHVFVTLFGGDQGRATEVLVMVLPLVTTLLCELGTIVFLGLGLGHAPARKPVVAVEPSKPKKRAPTKRKHEAVADFAAAFEAKHDRKPQWAEVRAAGFTKATASRGLKRATG